MKTKVKYISISILVMAIILSGVVFIFRSKIMAHYIPRIEQIGDIHIRVKNDTSYISTRLSIKNRSFLKIEVDTIKYKISLFNKTYLKNEKFIGMALQGYGKDTLEFSLKVPSSAILKDLKAERKKGDSATYFINISLQYSTLFGKAEIPINRSAKIKIPQPPELEVVGIKYKKVRLRSILADAKIKITNYNDITLSIKEMNYSMNILKQGKLKGSLRIPIDIKPNGTTFINIPVEINVNNIGKTIFQVLINKDSYDYTLTLNAILESTDPMKESFHVDLIKNGKMELKK